MRNNVVIIVAKGAGWDSDSVWQPLKKRTRAHTQHRHTFSVGKECLLKKDSCLGGWQRWQNDTLSAAMPHSGGQSIVGTFLPIYKIEVKFLIESKSF